MTDPSNKTHKPPLALHEDSWVVYSRKTGAKAFITTNYDLLALLDADKAYVLTMGEHLATLNKRPPHRD